MKSKEETAQHEEDETTAQDSSDINPWLVNATQLPQQISPEQIKQISPSALAYLGDAIYELYVRMFFLWPQQR
ncbi:MAG: ribonuclease III, partial [Dolichospermum sp.]